MTTGFSLKQVHLRELLTDDMISVIIENPQRGNQKIENQGY